MSKYGKKTYSPYGGIIRIRFLGYVLSRAFLTQHPV